MFRMIKFQLLFAIFSLLREKKNEPSVNYTKKAAYEILLADVKPVTGEKISLNGTDEAADIILKKYESLN